MRIQVGSQTMVRISQLFTNQSIVRLDRQGSGSRRDSCISLSVWASQRGSGVREARCCLQTQTKKHTQHTDTNTHTHILNTYTCAPTQAGVNTHTHSHTQTCACISPQSTQAHLPTYRCKLTKKKPPSLSLLRTVCSLLRPRAFLYTHTHHQWRVVWNPIKTKQLGKSGLDVREG